MTRTTMNLGAAVLATLLVFASPGYAQLGLPVEDPTIGFNLTGTTNYIAADGSLEITATADSVKLGDAVTWIDSGSLTIHASVDSSGALVNGSLKVDGNIPEWGIMPADGVLLTGSALAFGFINEPDAFQFRFKITSGDLTFLTQYLGKDLVVSVTLNTFMAVSTFGDLGPPLFGSDFSAGAEGYVYATPGADRGWGGEELPLCTGAIGDLVWNDINRNGIQDWFEQGIPDVPIDLWRFDGTAWIPVASVNTNSSGQYSFPSLSCPATYRVQVATPEGFTASPTLQGGNVALDSNPSPSEVALSLEHPADSNVDFGFYEESTGAFMTITQGGWGSQPAGRNPGNRLADRFTYVYPSSIYPLGVVIGDATSGACPADGPYWLNFASASAIQTFLPQGGRPAPLTQCVPDTKKLTVLAGQVLALTLNVDFSYMGVTPPGLGMLKVVSGPLQGWTVNRVLALGNWVLSGRAPTAFSADVPSALTLSQINDVIAEISNNYEGGTIDRGYLAP